MENTIDLSTSGSFLHSDITIESPEFLRKLPSLQLSCRSSNSSPKSSGSTADIEAASFCSMENGSFRHGSDSDTVIHCSNGNFQSAQSNLHSVQYTSSGVSSDTAVNWELDRTSKGSRLDQVLDRIFVQVSPEGDIKINHLACLAHIQKVIRETVQGAQILVFNCQEPDPNVTQMFNQTIDCCFDLNSTPDLQSFIRFCEMCYDWLAGSGSNTVLFHAESPTATKRLLLLLFAYACFCDSVERQNIRTSKRLKAYLSTYPNGKTSVPVVYLRYSAYMKIFTPFRRQSISRATMSVYSIVVHNCPLFTNHSASIFFKFYSYSPLQHVYTTDVHKLSGRMSERVVLLLTEEPISLRGNVVILCYRLKPEKLERRRILKLTFHSCEGYKEMLTFNYDAFDEISEAVPATFKMDLYLTPKMNDKSESATRNNLFLENTKEIRHWNNQHLPLFDSIDPLNIIQSRDIPLEAVRLSDSLEDIDHAPNRSSLLIDTRVLEEVSRELVRKRSQTFNDFFMNTYGRQENKQWSFPMRFKRPAPKPPLSPNLRSQKVSKASAEDLSSIYEMSSRGSIDSESGLHSDASDVSERNLKRITKIGFAKVKKKIKGVIDLKSYKSPKSKKSSNDDEIMPPPVTSVVPRARTEGTAPKSVIFLNATPKKVPPPRPPPPKLQEKMDTDEMGKERQRKTPAGVRSVPTQYFGPLEKYQRLAGKDFASVRSYRLQLHQSVSERSTPTIIEEQEAEDFEEAEYRQLQKEGYNFSQHLVDNSGTMSTTATTQDLDQLLEELRRTSLDYSSTTTRSPASHPNGTHSSRLYSGYQRPTFAEPGGGSAAGSYQRSQAYSTERGMGEKRGTTTGEGGGFVRHATPAPQLSSSQRQRYQTTFRTTLQHKPPVSPKWFNQINVTIDPEFGTASPSMAPDNRGYLTPSLSRTQRTPVTAPMDESSEMMSYRELQLLEELSSARQELAMLKRASSVIEEPLHKLPPPSTLPTQRRAFQQHHENVEMFSNRHQAHYQSHHDIQQGSSLYRPHGRYESMNSGFAFGAPKRAMSSANVTASQSWNYRNGMVSGPQSPAPGYSSIRSIGGSLRGGGMLSSSQGYSARRERLRQEAEQAEALRQSTQRINHVSAASSNDLRSTSLHQQRRQHYHSMSTIQPERTEFEEIETVTLQPIGRGVQDLSSNMGSTATLNRSTRRPVASSMLEGLNRTDNYAGARQQRANMTSFGRQTSAMDIPQTMSARPQRAASNSFLSSLRRQSDGTVSETSSFQQQMTATKSTNLGGQQFRQQHLQSLQTNQQSSKYAPTMQHQSQSQQQPVLFQNQQQQHQQRTRTDSGWASQQNSTSSTLTASGPVDLALVEATSPVWYRLKISRQEAISILKNQPPGSFLVRDSTTFKDAYGLAVKSTKPPSKTGQKSGFAKFMKNILNDINNDLVRHYLIETVTTPNRGVRIKGFSAEQVFPSLLALIQYHTQYPVALPCCLVLPPIPPSQAGPVITASNSTLVRNGTGSGSGTGNGDSDSVTLVQNNGVRSVDQNSVNFNGNVAATDTLEAPPPARSITSPLSPTAGMFHSELLSPPPSISCRCLHLGAVEVDTNQGQASLMQAVDTLVPSSVLQAATCDQMGVESPVQYTECQLQAAHNEGILLTDLSRKLFFQRHFPANSFIYAGVDPRDKAFIHPNHSALGLDKPKLFGFITKKLSGEYMVQVFSEFDANCSAAAVTAQINSLLLNK
ncbi:Tensin-3 [Taenia crassiceps]|uniref:Tensin-3 n=1 Tax=Taenia crassiceps TaxID=6207 RepID=A0ABR4QIU4_9CEST